MIGYLPKFVPKQFILGVWRFILNDFLIVVEVDNEAVVKNEIDVVTVTDGSYLKGGSRSV